MNDLRLSFGQIRRVPTHVIEENGQVLDAELVERFQLALEALARDTIEVLVDLVRTEADAKSNICSSANRPHCGELRQHRRGMQFPPPATQKWIGLGRVEIEAIAMW
jgi:hypothetical protein